LFYAFLIFSNENTSEFNLSLIEAWLQKVGRLFPSSGFLTQPGGVVVILSAFILFLLGARGEYLFQRDAPRTGQEANQAG
jgi:hypothetical protein